jgi:hypothetical protein
MNLTPEQVKQFQAWADGKGYDIAHTYDTERSRWVFLNPMTADLFEAWQAALLRSAGDGWISVLDELPPDREMVAVAWLDVEDHDHADRYSIDYREDGVWQCYFSEHEHYLIAGVARGNSEDAPYTHWQRIGTLPNPPVHEGGGTC